MCYQMFAQAYLFFFEIFPNGTFDTIHEPDSATHTLLYFFLIIHFAITCMKPYDIELVGDNNGFPLQ